MTKNKTKQNGNHVIVGRLNQINKVIKQFENELEKTFGRFVKKGEKSGQILRKNFDEIIEKISSTELYAKASETTDGLSKEVKRLADDVVGKFKNFDIRVANNVVKDVRSNLDQIIEKVQSAGLLETAKAKAEDTKNQVLHVLNIPSLVEVDRLNRKINSLEKKLNTLARQKVAA